ncbi:hypothetical protein Golomagni_04459 [Golovinomyces magnicellulatus]|nr:hypothetical protein Golomagni_04459 [Golovinomyces magnicellulatus]
MILPTSLALASTLLLALPVNADLYPKGSAVLSVDGKDYDRIIGQSNYTSIVEFYSPGCIHCRNLMPIYEKSAQKLAGLAKVAAVNCDKESNRAFCGSFGITGFPTLKISKPRKTNGKPIVEEYQGARSVKDIVETLIDKIQNYVEKPSQENIDNWIQDADGALAILFTTKPKINPLLKALAIEFKGGIKFAHVQISESDKSIIDRFEIKKLPTLMLLKDGKESGRLLHDGEMKKDILVKFLSQAVPPNPDPAPLKVKENITKPIAPEVEAQKPIIPPVSVSPLVVLDKKDELIGTCLGLKTGTCLLVFSPESADKNTLSLIDAMTQITHKRKQHKRSSIPAYILPESNPKYATLKDVLSLTDKAEVIAINGKRSWWRHLTNVDFASPSTVESSLDTWMSSIQLGEGEKMTLPASLIIEEFTESAKVMADESHSEDSPKVEEPLNEEKSEETVNGDHDDLLNQQSHHEDSSKVEEPLNEEKSEETVNGDHDELLNQQSHHEDSSKVKEPFNDEEMPEETVNGEHDELLNQQSHHKDSSKVKEPFNDEEMPEETVNGEHDEL